MKRRSRRESRQHVREQLDEAAAMMSSNDRPGPQLDRRLLTQKQHERFDTLTVRYHRTRFEGFDYDDLCEMRALLNCSYSWRHPDFKTGEWVPVDPRAVERDMAILERINADITAMPAGDRT